jgi:putative flippase GtrA
MPKGLTDCATAARFSIRPDLMRYLAVGLLNTAIGLATIYLAILIFHADDVVANVVGYSVGLACSFVLNRRWTFDSGASIAPQLLRFLLVMLVAYLANLGTVMGLTRLLAQNRYLAQAAGAIPYTLIGYLGSRFLAFSQRAQ